MTFAIQAVSAAGYLPAPNATPGVGGASFADTLAGAVDGAQRLQGEAKSAALTAITGDLGDIQTATIAATRAQVTLELVAAVRNKGIDAFNEIMRMQA